MENVQATDLNISEKGLCHVCLKKVRWNEGDSGGGKQKDEETTPEIAPKSMVCRPGFLRTFNEIWRILCENQNVSNVFGGISLEAVITEGLGSKATFSKAPTLCQLCCDKIEAVENLIKAVKQQVREIQMLLEESRTKQRNRVQDFGEEVEGNDKILMITL